MNFKNLNKDRELLPKNYVDIHLNSALCYPKDRYAFTFRGFLVKERVKSSGFRSNRDLLVKGMLNPGTLEELKSPSLPSIPNLQAQSTKASISNPISQLAGFQQNIDESCQDQVNILKKLKEKTTSQLPNTCQGGFRGYKFSVLNKNRNLVKSKKNRYRDKEYNLDLTYITPRIIAMSIPGQGVHKVYRNSIDSVSSFVNERHRGFYKILNLSGLKYDYKKFDNRVQDYPWQDHYPPPIELLFKACEEMHNWLYLHEKNIIIVHCRAGKGRTGTLICCYLLYSQRLFHPDDALTYYKYKRFSIGGGVTQPSQKRYVRYFSEIFDGHIKSPNILQLRCIKMFTVPHMASNSCRPIIELMINKQKVFHNKKASRDHQFVLYDNNEEKKMHELALANSEVMLCGDIDCFLSHWGRLKMKKICRFSFNTAFYEPDTSLDLKKDQLDPDTFKNNKEVDDEFCIEISFDARKCGCHNRMTVLERCVECRRMIRQEECEKWNEIQRILIERIKADPKVMLFGDEDDDIDYVINTVIQGSCSLSEGSND